MAEWLGACVDRYVPAEYIAMAAQMAPYLDRARGMLPFRLPEIPANMPNSPAGVKALIAGELFLVPAAELVRFIQAAPTDVWLAEYAASLDTSFHTLDHPDSAARLTPVPLDLQASRAAQTSDPEQLTSAAEEIASGSPHDDPTPVQ